MIEREKTLELKKHVAAIHSSNKLTLVQRKIANALLFNAYDDLLVKDEHQVHIRTLCNLIGYDSNDYKTIKKALVNLLSTVIEWNLVDGSRLESEGVWNASSIIADASIDGPVCTYSYSNKMKKLLHSPELYGRLNMMVQAKFQSTYGLALYENCIRFQNIDQTPWFEIAKFRKLMGVEDGKYAIFRDFKRRVLDKAIEEVNKFSPINVSTKFQKQGRQVTAIQFLLKREKEVVMEIEDKSDDLVLSQQLKSRFGFSKGQIEDTLSQYEEAYIREKITIVETSSSFIKGKISNVAKYLLHALECDYQPAKSSKDLLKVSKVNRKQAEPQKKVEDNNLVSYRRYQHKQLIEIFNKQTKARKNKILKEFEQNLGKSLYLDIYLRDGLKNVLVIDQLCEFLKLKKPEYLKSIETFAEYCQKA
jgi:plasmid replication initiation protein